MGQNRTHHSIHLAWTQCAVLGSPSPDASSWQTQAEVRVTTQATGTFEVALTPQSTVDSAANLGRMSIVKQYHGDLEGTSRGEMLTVLTGVPGSAGYVAIERVSGTLQGRRGTFVLQHSATMTHAAQQLSIAVVPDSGTDELVGLAGTLMITIADGRHSYTLDYSIGTSH